MALIDWYASSIEVTGAFGYHFVIVSVLRFTSFTISVLAQMEVTRMERFILQQIIWKKNVLEFD